MSAALSLHIAGDGDAHDLLHWRNLPHVRASMITQDEITLEGHLKWWARAQHDPARRFMIVKQDDVSVAVLNYFDIAEDGTGWWGFYLTDRVETGSDRLAIWMAVEGLALRYAFEVLGLTALYCETRASNEPVLMLHDRFRFETLRPDDFPNALAHDLIVKRMTAQIYTDHKERLIMADVADATLPVAPQAPAKSRLVFTGSANWDDIAADFGEALVGYCALDLDVAVPPFGQAMMQLMNPASDLAGSPPEYIVFCERAEDFMLALDTPTDAMAQTLQDRFDDYIQTLRDLRGQYTAHFFVHDLALIRPRVSSLYDQTADHDALNVQVAAMNTALAALCAELPDCTLLPVGQVLDEVGHGAADPGKFWLMGRFPYGAKFTPAYHRLLSGALMALHGLTARALVLDLDNTCWGGVVGDDGTFGIKMGSDYPGNQFTAFQKFIKTVSERGIILTVCSKNTEEVALDAFRNNPDMVITEADLLTHRINWTPKSQNIGEIAQEVDLGLRNLMFIDDNPMERMEVRQNMPGVIVPEMPDDVSQWPAFLATHPALSALHLLDQDRDRVTKYKIRKQIQDVEKTSTDRNAFLRKLGMRIEIKPVEPATQARALQLFAKTNQFNTTTTRYSEGDVQGVIASGGDVLTVRIQDKFGSDEVIAVLVIRYEGDTALIENFVMSCRVLGRGIETAILADVCKRSIAHGCTTLHGPVIETERNQPCRDVYARNKFAAQDGGLFTLNLDTPTPFPDWFEYD
jgi:FkbH-like protein